MYLHKCSKWYHTIFHRIIETVLINGCIIYSAATYLDFQIFIYKYLSQTLELKNVNIPAKKVKNWLRVDKVIAVKTVCSFLAHHCPGNLHIYCLLIYTVACRWFAGYSRPTMDDEFDRDWKLSAQPVVRLQREECSRCISFIIQSVLRVAMLRESS